MRTGWNVAEVIGVTQETTTARTLRLRLPGLTGHRAGQHVDIRLTAPDGYTAVRSYSVASARPGEEIDLTVEELTDGEVSPYLVHQVAAGDQLEVRGPVGGWFVWDPADPSPVQLIAGGSGVVPLMAMLRAHAVADPASAGGSAPFRLLYSVRGPAAVYYRAELDELARSPLVDVTLVYTREAPAGSPSPARRLDAATLTARALPAADNPAVFICGATAFVETVADWLVQAGHSPERIKTERYGGMGAKP
ncbi:ferredoxin reductase [Cryobacterium sp.]|uniref:ferredoxin reductase n=1 Tax=Cryobacterium sp. TaxID=1926290 RepID=UPI002632493A|nr:ferredoxin reductase [Cryobacterium sp.]MCU1447004.1 oxidoreductase [Cryobacterium sp.]